MFEQIKRKILRANKKLTAKKIKLSQGKNSGKVNLASPIELDGLVFSALFLGSREDTLWGKDDSGKAFVKIGIKKHERKLNDVRGEAEVIEQLNNRGALSCPKLMGKGEVSVSKLPSDLSIDGESVPYLLTEFIESAKDCTFSDLVFTLLEQKALGVYQGDVKPANIVFDESRAVAVLLDYDQAEILDDPTRTMGSVDFFQWTFKREQEKYGQENWLRHFNGQVSSDDLKNLFRNDSFNLAETSVYLKQRTTNTDSGIYHTLDTKRVFADGVRSLDDRKFILDKIDFSNGEKTLDIGCNVGLLAMYLRDRGCESYGYELDPYIVNAAKMISNILDLGISYDDVDLDQHEFSQSFDTICLFSVFHHTKNMIENGKKIANACNRVIIECRLVERGKKPVEDSLTWEKTSSWDYASEDELYKGLEGYFPGFKVTNNFGSVDKHRYIIELKK